MTTIVVNNKGELFIDGNPKLIDDLTQDFLEKLVDDSLRDEVSFDIDGDMPLATFLKKYKMVLKQALRLEKRWKSRNRMTPTVSPLLMFPLKGLIAIRSGTAFN